MSQKASFEQRLEALAREQFEETQLRGLDFIKARLRSEDWSYLLARLTKFAEQEIRSRKWRGDRTGVLPDGADASSIASEVVLRALEGKARLAPGWTRERLEMELQRLVSNEVRRLHKRKEAGSVRNEWDVLRPTETGELPSVLDEIVDTRSSGTNGKAVCEAMNQARAAEDDRIAKELRDEDEMAGKVFECLRQGMRKRREIAAKLGISVEAVTNCRKRLERKRAAWLRVDSCRVVNSSILGDS